MPAQDTSWEMPEPGEHLGVGPTIIPAEICYINSKAFQGIYSLKWPGRLAIFCHEKRN